MIIRNIFARYGNNDILVPQDLELSDVDFSLVVGESGVGKTTFLRLLSGIDFNGNKVCDEEFYYFDEVFLSSFSFNTTVEKLCKFLSTNDDFQSDVFNRIYDFNIKKKDFLINISKGQKQIILNMITISFSQKYYLFDEPLSGLDILSKQKMIDLMIEIQGESNNRHFIIATHELKYFENIVEQIIIVEQKKIYPILCNELFAKYGTVYGDETIVGYPYEKCGSITKYIVEIDTYADAHEVKLEELVSMFLQEGVECNIRGKNLCSKI